MMKYQIIYWRDIPAQVKVKMGRKRGGKPLSNRFPVAIDEAAMRAGITESDVYLAQWRKGEWQEQEGDFEDVATAIVNELEAAYPPERLRNLIKQHGLEEAQK
ncbi:MAG: hypothetical protein GWP61_27170 [Chloroflexi bacterium]|jgi:hypothetical protein|nr:hypothetical protein [Chloroflexota bacterium]